MSVRVKVCGLNRFEDVAAVGAARAAYAGFVFFPKSPRNVAKDAARALALEVPQGIAKVALVVDASDALLDEILKVVPIDILQLHGAESPTRVEEIKMRYGLPVMKAVGVADEADLSAIPEYAAVSDMLLIDAKPPKTSDLPGGNGLAFDWRLIAGRRWDVPWMLAGGLTPDNVAEAIKLTGAKQVDVSTGIDASPGVKDAKKIAAFAHAVHAVSPA